ncbi:MAG: hypothetical protein JST90_19565 [Bacteroidetes bacterium]|nr:hypothetical protein [Bacteroidota bacterium]
MALTSWKLDGATTPTFTFENVTGTCTISYGGTSLVLKANEIHQWAIVKSGNDQYFQDKLLTGWGSVTNDPGAGMNNANLKVKLSPASGAITLIGNGDVRNGGDGLYSFTIDITNSTATVVKCVVVSVDKSWFTGKTPV